MNKGKLRNTGRKSEIIDVAAKLYWEHGFSETTIKDIALVWGFEASNLYNYFRSKEHILYEVLLKEQKEALRSIKPAKNSCQDSPAKRLYDCIFSTVQYNVTKGRLLGMLFDAALKHLTPAHRIKIISLRDVYDRTLSDIIQKGVDMGEFAKTTNVRMSTFAIINMVARVRVWFSPQGKLSADELGDFLAKFALNALGYDKTLIQKKADQLFKEARRNTGQEALIEKALNLNKGD